MIYNSNSWSRTDLLDWNDSRCTACFRFYAKDFFSFWTGIIIAHWVVFMATLYFATEVPKKEQRVSKTNKVQFVLGCFVDNVLFVKSFMIARFYFSDQCSKHCTCSGETFTSLYSKGYWCLVASVFLGGLSLHLNHLIAERVSAPYRQFGTLPIGIFLSNLVSGQLETSLMISYCHFWNLSTFGDSRAIWVFWPKLGVFRKSKFSRWRSDGASMRLGGGFR